MMRRVRRAGARLLWLNLVVLLFVCLLPFSTGVIARYGDTLPGGEVYSANLVLVATGFWLVSLHLARTPQLPPRAALRAGIFALIFLAALPAALWHLEAAWAVWVTAAIVGRIMDRTSAPWRLPRVQAPTGR